VRRSEGSYEALGLVVTEGSRPQPEQLVRELKVVLKVGTRPARLVTRLNDLQGLVSLCAADLPADLRYDQAIRIATAVATAVDALGDGPYGGAVGALFGVRPSTRGLLLPQRRKEAARGLCVEPTTLVRHWEREILEDLAVSLYAEPIAFSHDFA
jgi:hypothetical protein